MRSLSPLLLLCVGCETLVYQHGALGPTTPDPDPGEDRMIEITGAITGTFFIDQYEASILSGDLGDATLDSDGDNAISNLVVVETHEHTHRIPFDEDPANPGELDPAESATDLGTAVAISVPDVLPATNVTFMQAASACANAGKRLCTKDEWEYVCQNAEAANRFPYGDTPLASEVGVHCWTENLGGAIVHPTGSAAGCVTTTNVFDMSGNVSEWTEYRGSQAVFSGGAQDDLVTKADCPEFLVVDIATTTDRRGFRCCRSAVP